MRVLRARRAGAIAPIVGRVLPFARLRGARPSVPAPPDALAVPVAGRAAGGRRVAGGRLTTVRVAENRRVGVARRSKSNRSHALVFATVCVGVPFLGARAVGDLYLLRRGAWPDAELLEGAAHRAARGQAPGI
eukprot:CAMPEP_0180031400 /NCGR_PEP_ID=MMETSP0984-20121128/27896_1 /TAXON_ID=483367 /ORGANISM="non described non described, Strain CCMP 2436" /LENGTH=132 /DNA_ID=CAMNT_0021956551 /DNA_START=385 /DNA_END=783 /DNA_ORIENTATION=+